eukprot:2972964-Amphidinium_carterae.1
MKSEAQHLCRHVANERQELLSSCNRKAEETVNILRSQLEAEKANVETAVKRQLHSKREKMARDLQAQQEVSLGQIRAEFEKAQQEIQELRSLLGSTERERDSSMQQLAVERIRTSQMQTQGTQLLFERDALSTQFMDLTRHAARSRACQNIQWSDKEPEGFTDFVEQVSSSADEGIHVVPPFASQHLSSPPGLFDVVVEAPAASQTPDRRPGHSTSSPMFGLFSTMIGDRDDRGSGKGKSNGAKSNPDRVDGTPYSRGGRSDRNPRMVGGSGSTRIPGRGGDGDDDDDDDDEGGFPIGGVHRQPHFDGWNEKNDTWARNRKQLCIAASPGAPGGDDGPGGDPLRFLG